MFTVIVTRPSLQELVELSRDERFRRSVQEIEIYLAVLNDASRTRINNGLVSKSEADEFKQLMDKLGLDPKNYIARQHLPCWPELPVRHPEIAAWEAKLRRKRRRLHDKHMHDQHLIRANGIDLKLLTRALSNFPRLKAIRTINTLDIKHPPLGVHALRNDIGMWPMAWAMPHSIPLLLGVLHRTGIQIEELTLCEAPWDLFIAPTPTSRKPFRTSTPQSTFAHSQFADLRLAKLHRFSLSFVSCGFTETRSSAFPSWLHPLVSRMQALRELTVENTLDIRLRDLLYVLENSLPPTAHLRVLEMQNLNDTLELFHVSLAALESFLGQHRTTLRRFSCWWRDSARLETKNMGAKIAKMLLHMDMPCLREVELWGADLQRVPVPSTVVKAVCQTAEELREKLEEVIG